MTTQTNYERSAAPQDLATFLAVYDGAGGPISFTVEAEGPGHAARIARLEIKTRFNDQENYLDLPPETTPEATHAAALEQGWELAVDGSERGDSLSIYRTSPVSRYTTHPGIDGAEWRIRPQEGKYVVEHITSAGASIETVLSPNTYPSVEEAIRDCDTVDQESAAT